MWGSAGEAESSGFATVHLCLFSGDLADINNLGFREEDLPVIAADVFGAVGNYFLISFMIGVNELGHVRVSLMLRSLAFVGAGSFHWNLLHRIFFG